MLNKIWGPPFPLPYAIYEIHTHNLVAIQTKTEFGVTTYRAVPHLSDGYHISWTNQKHCKTVAKGVDKNNVQARQMYRDTYVEWIKGVTTTR